MLVTCMNEICKHVRPWTGYSGFVLEHRPSINSPAVSTMTSLMFLPLSTSMTGNLKLTSFKRVNWNGRRTVSMQIKTLKITRQAIELCINNIAYTLEKGEGASEKCALCMLVKLSIILNDL